MRPWLRVTLCATSGLLFLAAAFLPTSQAGVPFRVKAKTSVEDLAEKIDKLERALQYYGRVTAKAPDVWGQARLTQHRREFEEQMAEQLTAFTANLNAEISVSDQAFLSEAVSISAAAQGQTVPELTTVTSATSTFTPIPATGAATEPATSTSNVISRTGPFGAFGKSTGQGSLPLSVEPEILLDQRKRFLDHLHEIRRVNEGDDTADAPGYSLNLVRIPISVIPGDKTRENFGAEITVTVEPHVTEELLPSTFRELVINDLIDQLSLPIVKVLDLTWKELSEGATARGQIELTGYQIKRCSQLLGDLSDPDNAKPDRRELVLRRFGVSLDKLMLDADTKEGQAWETNSSKDWKERLGGALGQNNRAQALQGIQLEQACQKLITKLQLEREAAINKSRIILAQAVSKGITSIGIQSPRERRSRYPIPATQIRNVFGTQEIGELAVAVFAARDRFQCRDRVQLADVQGLLRNELAHAYDFLSSTTCPELVPPLVTPVGAVEPIPSCDLWHSPFAPTAAEIRQPNAVIAKRKNFFSSLPTNAEYVATHEDYVDLNKHDSHAETATEALAWAILVESALLNQQLNEDVQRVSQDPNCHCMAPGQELCFYGPNPDPVARQAFADYVRCRWPIRVFALDPVTQQQNVADSFSLRREMQLAVALAFKQQFVNAQSLTRYMRRIEQDIRTIALNQTVVAFGAGDDTFGWRFFPRVQTPDVEGTLTVVARDMIAGGPRKDSGLKKRRMEPGMRECVALVVMPSFIKHVRFDVRSNWFPLVPSHVTKAFHTAKTPPSMETTVEWSRLVKSIEDSAMACMVDQHQYRDGEVDRLLKRNKQLSQELPINTMYSSVPYENTLGGFEMFASGVTDLAPELVGFYGAPGIDTNSTTELFLVGDHFSVHDTHVIAGNKDVKFKMLSREVVQASIPTDVRIEKRLSKPRTGSDEIDCPGCPDGDCDSPYVEVRLATPYGVSSSLWVPVIPASSTVVASIRWDREKYNVTYCFRPDAANVFAVANEDLRAVAPHQFAIDIPANYWNNSTKVALTITATAADGTPILTAHEVPERLVPGGRCVISGTEFLRLQVAIKDAVATKLKGANPPAKFTVFLSAKGKFDSDDKRVFDVSNTLEMCVRFTPK